VVRPLPTTPTFVLPYKRFAAPSLLALATQYLNGLRHTYRSVVRHDRCLIGYPLSKHNAAAQAATTSPQTPAPQDNVQQQDTLPQDTPAQADDDQAVIPPSLVWRFVGWLGGLTLTLDKAREMILQQNPNSLCHRMAGNVPPHKARSTERLRVLETARQLLLVMPEWEECFDNQLFPRFATRSGFD